MPSLFKAIFKVQELALLNLLHLSLFPALQIQPNQGEINTDSERSAGEIR